MQHRIMTGLAGAGVLALALTGCATKVNPLNWFGDGSPAPVVAPSENTNPLIPGSSGLFKSDSDDVVFGGRNLETVNSLVIERVPGGAILRVTGLAAQQGAYAVQLTPANPDEEAVEGVLTYRLEGLQGPGASDGAPLSREVVVARKVTNQTLQGVQTIRVEAQTNAVQARR